MDEIKIWIISAVILVLLAVLGWIMRLAILGVYKRLDRLINQNTALNIRLTKQDGDITTLKSRVETNETRLNDHAGRIRQIEINE